MARFKLDDGRIVQGDQSVTLSEQVVIPVPAVIVQHPDGIDPVTGEVLQGGLEVLAEAMTRTELQPIEHPRGVGAMTATEREARNIVEVIEQPRPDDRLAFVSEDPASPNAWLVTPWPGDSIVAALKAHAAAVRWGKETGGIEIAGVQVATDDTAQRKISELRRRAEAGEILMPFNFKGRDGWHLFDEVAIRGIDQALAAHVRACYELEGAVSAAIDAGTITTFEAVDQAFGNG